MRPLIGITTGEIINHTYPWAPVTYGQSHTYSDAVIRAGGLPVLIPITEDSETLRQIYTRLDGMLFAGGNDIDPDLYQAKSHPKTEKVSKKRDSTELQLLRWALSDDLPVLAICRGAQLLNVVSGGTLYQDIASEVEGSGNHEISTIKQNGKHIAHTLILDEDSHFAKIIRSTTIDANSHHHQSIKDVAESLRATARAEDGVIEAVEKPNATFTIGVQCHPESLLDTDAKWLVLFEYFAETSAAQKHT